MTETLSFPGLGLEFELSRVLISVGNFTIYWYGVLLALGFLVGVSYALKRSKEFGVHADRASDVILISAVGAIICARLYYVVFSWEYYSKHTDEIFKIWNGGIAIYGAVIGAFLTAIVACKIRKVKFLPLADTAAGGLLIGQAIGRWGNFVNIEAFGENTDLPWGMTSPTIVNYLTSVQEDMTALGVTIDPNAPVHPTFFYESMWCLIGFLLIALVLTKRRRFDGELLLFYIGWYGLGRFFIEGLRTDSLMLGTIRVSQLVAILCVIVAVLAWLVIRSKIKSANDPEYLKPYAQTEEAALVVSGEYYKNLAEEKKAAKAAKNAVEIPAEEKPEETAEVVSEEITEESASTESTADEAVSDEDTKTPDSEEK